MIRSCYSAPLRSLHFSSSYFSLVSSCLPGNSFYSVSDASTRLRICDFDLFDGSAVAYPKPRMPLHSLTVSKLLISFSFATIRQRSTLVVSVDRPPLYYSIKLSYNTMIPGFGWRFDLSLA